MIKEVVVVVVLVLFCFVSGFTLSVSESNPLKPHAAEDSFSLGYIQMTSAENCSYLVVISTSCSSPKYTTDQISIAFGDAHGNQVYAARLDDPISGTFEQCSSDTFQIDGACTSDICYAYLRRSASSSSSDHHGGWKPETVKIYGFSEPVTFYFNTTIPNDTWYGYNTCETPAPPPPPTPLPPPPPAPSSSYKFSSTPIMYVALGFVLGSFWM